MKKIKTKKTPQSGLFILHFSIGKICSSVSEIVNKSQTNFSVSSINQIVSKFYNKRISGFCWLKKNLFDRNFVRHKILNFKHLFLIITTVIRLWFTQLKKVSRFSTRKQLLVWIHIFSLKKRFNCMNFRLQLFKVVRERDFAT